VRRVLFGFLAIAIVLPVALLTGARADSGTHAEAPAQRPDEQAYDITALQPDPKLSPEQIVRIQVEALGKKDIPYENAGIEIVFRFVSPANKRITGPLERFIRMISGPIYFPMLNYHEVQFGEIRATEDKATQSVVITSKNGRKVGYLFSLSKQKTGRYATSWMTDSVTRFEVQGEPNPLFMI